MLRRLLFRRNRRGRRCRILLWLLVLCLVVLKDGGGGGEGKPAWIQIKPGPSEDGDQVLDLIVVSPSDGEVSKGVVSLSEDFLWDSMSELTSVDGVEGSVSAAIFSLSENPSIFQIKIHYSNVKN